MPCPRVLWYVCAETRACIKSEWEGMECEPGATRTQKQNRWVAAVEMQQRCWSRTE
jgi:hypothetical protein